jgi:phosphate acetyltransferase
MLSNKKIVCPNNLINLAKKSGTVDAAIVNAGEIFPMESVHKAVQHELINPIFIGNDSEIKKHAEKLNWDISKYKIIDEKDENSTASIAAKLASEGKAKIIVKGHIHTDVLIKAVFKRTLNLIGKKRLSHIWHMTLGADDKPFIITDGVINVLPKLGVKMHILRNAVDFANRIGISRPKVSILSATEEVLESVPSSVEANLITKKAKEEKINADVFGPLAFDNSVSKKSAAIKKIKNEVAGNTDILLVPNVETGNALVKMMIYFMGACAAGVVVGCKAPVVITSRSDESEPRLASIAAAVVALEK